MKADEEKVSSDANHSQEGEAPDMPKDPDAHLSEEQKAEVVSGILLLVPACPC